MESRNFCRADLGMWCITSAIKITSRLLLADPPEFREAGSRQAVNPALVAFVDPLTDGRVQDPTL